LSGIEVVTIAENAAKVTRSRKVVGIPSKGICPRLCTISKKPPPLIIAR
jgi:hypothetical protein